MEHLCRDVVIIDEGSVVLSGRVDDLRAASPHRHVEIVVRNGGADWADAFAEENVSFRDGDRVRLEVDRGADPERFFALAAAAGEVIEFSFAPPPLSQVFREAVVE